MELTETGESVREKLNDTLDLDDSIAEGLNQSAVLLD